MDLDKQQSTYQIDIFLESLTNMKNAGLLIRNRHNSWCNWI